ncbi:Carboxylesterase type B [Penicillium alfredii]|uniref:Carboxylic ester hydrolase n=1 Tax=Penicillium alfredii TaxID=1506179 RepID=A0A9W9F1C6_9EURO|nr:Carboxylesterase type B [Penicillium alfredii]KAJ5091789.1 Carboxylesterase type B [Penicillium alfredii]
MAALWKSIGTVALLVTCFPAAWGQRVSDQPEKHVGASVHTSSGLVQGHIAARRSGVSEYLGIPYAAPPIGHLRFAAPVAYKENGTVHGKSYPHSDCPANPIPTPDYPGFTPQGPRIVKTFTQQVNNPQSEDCLYLNVWSKPTVSKPKPVLLWIHGGRFTLGGSHSPYYDGQGLAGDHDVVVVTINYRLNIFGFSGAPGLPQNTGLLDQRMAVEWVHRNIAAFGGDPERITIFGQSAGGSSVDYYSYAWADKPLASGLISHSGTASSFVPNTQEYSTSAFYNVSKTLGCGDSKRDAHKVVACVRQKPYRDILMAVGKVPAAKTPALPQPVFHPTVDGVTVFGDYKKLSAAGKFARLPYLVTSNDYEAGYYHISAYAANITLSEKAWDRFNLAAFTCPSGAAARDRVAHGVPTWQSRYFGDWDNLRLHPHSGAYHGVDLPMVFGTAKQVSGIANNERENDLSHYMASAWVAFAGDPKEGLSKFGWPRYNPEKKTLVGLGYKNSTHAEFLKPQQVEQGCAALHGDSLPGKGAF